MQIAVASAVLSACWLWAGNASARDELPQSHEQITLSFAPLVRATAPSVVNIYTSKVVRTRATSPLFDDPFFRRFFGQRFAVPGETRERVQNSLGSGVIVRADGLIVTNNHVIEGADDIKVVLADKREFEASVVGADERTDLAILRIENEGEAFPAAALGDSDVLEVGDLVIAVGNPFGVGQTVTSGIVSAVARTRVGISDLNFFIQTDAAINPGNSGGALVGMDGKIIGINTAIFSRSGGSIGIGFAIPANMVRSVVEGVTEGGRLVRPWFGASGQSVTADIANSLGLPRPTGVLINEVYDNSPAANAGLHVGDVVLSIEGRVVDDPESLRFRIATLKMETKATLDILRKGKAQQLMIAVQPPPEDIPRDVTQLVGEHPLAGAEVANLSPALADEIGMGGNPRGVIILRLRKGGTAQRLRFQPGDIVREINGETIKTIEGLLKAVEAPSRSWRVAIERDGKILSRVFQK
ncbi:MAG: DegQ family serine endoprotease [Rhodospirillales bacterium]|nr:DegQ family serine endoprotease [Rhodospirillales bacterium]MCW8861932.1 DegQ family serine endoprotease [Rhodospirillales bacterium]